MGHDQDALLTVPLWIDGKAYGLDASAAKFPLVSAKTDKLVHYAASASGDDARRACESAGEALKTWRRTAPAHRRAILWNAAQIWERKVDEIAGVQAAETSCTLAFAEWNILAAARYIREIAAATAEIRGGLPQRATDPDTGEEDDGLILATTEPVGAVLIIPPWNGAVILPSRAMSMALAAGCTIVLKASEKCPLTHHLLVKSFEEAGVPHGVINQVQARREDAAQITEALISHSLIRKIDFIGSAKVGSLVGQTAAKYLKPVLMELGGKGPAIVLDDAELEIAAHLCAVAATMHHGQICFSIERVIVQRSIADNFLPLLKAAMEQMASGTAVDKASADHAHELLVDAKEHGAEFLTGSPEYIGPQSLRPTLVINVSPEARIWDEETFGPSATVYLVDTDEEAAARANDSMYGLSAAVYSRDWERALRVSRQLQYGQVNVNKMTTSDLPTQPIQGVKGSGWGSSNSIWGIREFLVNKIISLSSSTAGGTAIA